MKRVLSSRMLRLALKGASLATLAGIAATTAVTAQAATISESMVQNYAAAMKRAANGKNINQVSKLLADDVLISLSRKGKSTSLDKKAYLQLLQRSWNDTSSYKYDITVDNIVTTGEQAKADVHTTETMVKDGKTLTFVTTSRSTLVAGDDNAVLLRSVAQVTIN